MVVETGYVGCGQPERHIRVVLGERSLPKRQVGPGERLVSGREVGFGLRSPAQLLYRFCPISFCRRQPGTDIGNGDCDFLDRQLRPRAFGCVPFEHVQLGPCSADATGPGQRYGERQAGRGKVLAMQEGGAQGPLGGCGIILC